MTAYEILQQKVDALKVELPCISLGYLGNYERWGNDTQWYVFLPHFGRVGTYGDAFSLGAGRDENTIPNAVANWDVNADKIRRMYHAVPNRVGNAHFRFGLIVDATGKALSLGINPPPRFESAEKAAEYLKHYNYPAVLVGA